jgi:iron-sulfur cluster repair protein YtfE (RIC family)
MMFHRSVPRLLHDEHAATASALGRAESILLRGNKTPPDRSDAEAAGAVSQLSRLLQVEAMSHFDFEEQMIFPLLSEHGEGDLAGLLLEEHGVIRAAAAELQEIASQAALIGFSNQSWATFQRLGNELSERLRSHIEKEETALLPILEEMLSPDVDTEIAARHAG